MLNDIDLPDTAAGGPDAGFDANDHAGSTAPPARFGRLALCVAAAGALAFGVMGTVAYGVWFNHDQRAYAEAMASTRQALGVTASAASTLLASSTPTAVPPRVVGAASAPTTSTTAATTGEEVEEEGSEQASWSGQVMQSQRLSAAPAETAVADAAPASSVHAARGAASSPDTPAQQPVGTGRAGKDGRIAPQDRHLRPANAKPKGGLLARMSLFFRRVNYRQHGTGRQQDPYAHP